MGKTPLNRLAHDDLALSGGKPPALDELYIGAEFEAAGHHSSHGDVHLTGAVSSRQHDDYNPLGGRYRVTMVVFGDAGQSPQCGKEAGVKVALNFCLRALAQHQNI